MNLNKTIRKALSKSNIKRHKIAAVAIYGGHVVVAQNMAGSGRSSDYSIHAEEMLLRKLRKLRFKERYGMPRVIVSRIRKDGSEGSAKPCLSCEMQLERYGIDECYYTTGIHGWTESWSGLEKLR